LCTPKVHAEVYARMHACTKSVRKVPELYASTRSVRKVPSVHLCVHMKCTQGTKNQFTKVEKKKFVLTSKCRHPKDFEIFFNITVKRTYRVHPKCPRAPEVYAEEYAYTTSVRKVPEVYACTRSVRKVPSVHFCGHMKCTQGTKKPVIKIEKKKVCVDRQNADTPKRLQKVFQHHSEVCTVYTRSVCMYVPNRKKSLC